MSSSDIGWSHGRPVGNGSICNYCGKEMKSGGVTRLKIHLMGYPRKGVTMCPKCPLEVRERLRQIRDSKGQATLMKLAVRERLCEKIRQMGRNSSDEEYQNLRNGSLMRRYVVPSAAVANQQLNEMEFERTHAGTDCSYRGGVDVAKKSSWSSMDGLECSHNVAAPNHPSENDGSQSPITDSNLGESFGILVSKFFVRNGIPAHVAADSHFLNMIYGAQRFGPEVAPPTPIEILGKHLDVLVKETKEKIKKLEPLWDEYGCSLLFDGWSRPTKMFIINFMVYSNGEVIFLDSVDASGKENDHQYVMQLLEEKIKEVGEHRVVQIVSGNANIYKKVCQELERKYNLYWTSCASHSIDLMFKTIAKQNIVHSTVHKGKLITDYMDSNDRFGSLIKQRCGRDLICFEKNLFTTNFYALRRLLLEKNVLQNFFKSTDRLELIDRYDYVGGLVKIIVLDNKFWEQAREAMNIMNLLHQALEGMNNEKYPNLGSVLQSVNNMKKLIQVTSPKYFVPLHEIIDEISANSMDEPLYKAAFFLNPRYHYKYHLGKDADLIKAVHDVFHKLFPHSKRKSQFGNEIVKFRDALATFGTTTAKAARQYMWPGEWWKMYGIDAPTLRLLAIRVLSQSASASPCKQNWCTFSFIHKRPRNNSAYVKLKKFVYCHYNMKMRTKRMERLNQRNGEPEEDLLDKLTLLSDDSVDDVERAFSKCISGSRMDHKDGQPDEEVVQAAREVGINLDAALVEIIETSYKPSQRQGHHENPSSDVNSSSSESDGFDSGDENEDDDICGDGEGSDYRDVGSDNCDVCTEDTFPLSSYNRDHSTLGSGETDCGEDHSTHSSEEKDCGTSSKIIAYQYSRRQKRKHDPSASKTQSLPYGEKHDPFYSKCYMSRKKIKHAYAVPSKRKNS